MRPRADYLNRQFARLTVHGEVVHTPPHTRRYWACHCCCGNWTIVRQDALATGNTRSCGCKRRKPTRPENCYVRSAD